MGKIVLERAVAYDLTFSPFNTKTRPSTGFWFSSQKHFFKDRKLTKQLYALDKGGSEIIHEFKYIGMDVYSHGYLEASSER